MPYTPIPVYRPEAKAGVGEDSVFDNESTDTQPSMDKKNAPLKPTKAPCKSCPYRKDAPSGLWARYEYEKLPPYDGPTWAQPIGVFMCHTEPESLCAGWVGCHGADHLLALRVTKADPSVYDYVSPVPLFAAGREAADHGIAGIEDPDDKARRMLPRLERKIARRKTVPQTVAGTDATMSNTDTTTNT